MHYYSIQPPDTLKDFVRCFWILESDTAGYVHRSMADVCAEMVFHYKGEFDEIMEGKTAPSFRSGVQGQSDKIKRFSINKCFGIFGVYFYPHAIPLIARICATELTNQMVDLQTLLGKAGTELEEKMMLAPCNSTRVNIITNFLEATLTRHNISNRSMLKAANYIIDTHGQVRIEQLAERFTLSQRQFERTFKNHTGFSPKLFSRIVRFHSTMQHYGHRDKSLTEIAHACGYYDQPHFIHEFRQFSGHDPKSYFFGTAEGNVWRQ